MLSTNQVKYYLNTLGSRSYWASEERIQLDMSSYYEPRFFKGADMYPRTFWFVKVKSSGLGFDSEFPPIQSVGTSKGGPVKEYKDVVLEGNVESRFLFAAVLSDDILPFSFRSVRLAVFPLIEDAAGYRLLGQTAAKTEGFPGLTSWLGKVESVWRVKRGEKADRMSACNWLNYQNKLTSQNPKSRYRVVYPNFQRVSVAARLDTDEVLELLHRETGIRAKNLVVDHGLYRFETDNEAEANYVTAILNSPEIDRRLGELRKRSQRTHPNIHKKIFDVAPIPKFDLHNASHVRLADLGRVCHSKVQDLLRQSESGSVEGLGKARSDVRESLRDELQEIDDLTIGILGSA